MNTDAIRTILARTGAIVTDNHFVYTSGKHGPCYINKDAIYPFTEETSKLCEKLAARFLDREVDVVVAPAVGAIILAQWTAHHLHYFTGKEVLAVYADKQENGDFVIKRGYEKLIPFNRVLVIEDLFTTGGSARKVVEAVRALDGYVTGVGGIANRGRVTAKDVGDVPKFFALLDIEMSAYDETDCPLCKAGIPVNIQLGHGLRFMEKRRRTA